MTSSSSWTIDKRLFLWNCGQYFCRILLKWWNGPELISISLINVPQILDGIGDSWDKKVETQVAKSSFSEALLLGPRLESAPPRISNRSRFQSRRRIKVKELWKFLRKRRNLSFCRGKTYKIENEGNLKFREHNQSRHPWWSVATRTKLTEAAACN